MTTINSGATHLALMAIQARPRNIGYTMPAREFASVDDAAAASTEARARLRGEAVITVLPRTPPAPEQEPDVDSPVVGAPLNMLTPCGWRFLLRLAALATGVRVRDVMSRTRNRSVVRGRDMAMAMIYRHTQLSMPEVGRHLGRHHTSVLHSLQKEGPTAKLVEPAAPAAPREPTEWLPPAHTPRPGKTALQSAVIRAYRHGIPASVVAEEYGCSAHSVSVIACLHGMRRTDFNQKRTYGVAAR